MSEQPDFLEMARASACVNDSVWASAHALIAIAERLDKQNELLERIANYLDFTKEQWEKSRETSTSTREDAQDEHKTG